MISDTEKNLPNQRKLTNAVFFAAIMVFVLLMVSVAASLVYAAREAEHVAFLTEKRIVRLEVERQLEIARRDQSQLSYWDEAYLALRDQPDPDFVHKRIADWVWEDFQFKSTLVVSSDYKGIVDVHEEAELDPSGRQYLIDQNSDLIKSAIQKYKKHRKKQKDGYIVLATTSGIPKLLAESAFRLADGKLSIITAQAIISNQEDTSIEEEDIRVLLTFKQITDDALEIFSRRTNLSNVKVFPAAALPNNKGLMALPNAGLPAGHYIGWEPNSPFPIILQSSAPLLIVLFVFSGAGIWFVGRRFAMVIEKLETSEKKNRFMAQHDVLTHLPNRGKFDSRVEKLIQSNKSDKSLQFAIISVDLDRFKAVNDTHGHQAGDVVIKTIAKRLSDLVGDKGIVARMGGDEFACLIVDNVERDTLTWLGEAIVETASHNILFNGGKTNIGASVGISIWPQDGENLNEMMRQSDMALYHAKEAGRGKVSFADEFDSDKKNRKAA